MLEKDEAQERHWRETIEYQLSKTMIQNGCLREYVRVSSGESFCRRV